MTREEGLRAITKRYEETRDKTKPYTEPDHYAITAFWERRRKDKELLYLRSRGVKKF